MISRRGFIGGLIATPALIGTGLLARPQGLIKLELIVPVFSDLPPYHPNCRCVYEVIPADSFYPQGLRISYIAVEDARLQVMDAFRKE